MIDGEITARLMPCSPSGRRLYCRELDWLSSSDPSLCLSTPAEAAPAIHADGRRRRAPEQPTSRGNAVRDGTRGCGCGFGENPPVGKPAGLEKNPPTGRPAGAFLHPHPHPRVSGRFRVPACVTTYIIKMHKFVNLNSQTSNFYK